MGQGVPGIHLNFFKNNIQLSHIPETALAQSVSFNPAKKEQTKKKERNRKKERNDMEGTEREGTKLDWKEREKEKKRKKERTN